MPLFRKKPSLPPAPPAREQPSVPIPKFRGDQLALGFEGQLAQGQWREFHDFLDGLTEWDLRSFYVSELSSISGRPQWLVTTGGAATGRPSL
jgi:hypothetical protein